MAFDQWIETDTITGAQAVYLLKEMLVAAGWTVESSGDGLLAYSASGDVISHSGSGAGGMANNYAWIRISNPEGVEYCFQRGTSNTMWRVTCSPVATFVTGSPDSTHVPSATDSGVVYGSGTDASPTMTFLFGTDSTYRFKGGADSVSPYHCWSAAFPNGGGTLTHFFLHEKLDAVAPTDGAPFHCVIGGNSADPSRASISAESTGGATTRSWATVAAVTPSTWTVMPGNYPTTAAGPFLPQVVNPITVKDELIPIIYGRRAAIASPGWKGVGTVMRWNGTTRTTGDTFSLSTTRDRLVLSDVSVPWKGTVPTV